MPARAHTLLLPAMAMIAFAGNSLLCRLALRSTSTDPASFTALRLVSGALTLWIVMRMRKQRAGGNWVSASALFLYAAAFSWAYLKLPAGAGALILFGSVQLTMIGWGMASGDRLSARQMGGIAIAVLGLVVLLRPGLDAPPLSGAALMAASGAAWGVYSLRGKSRTDPTGETAGNFMRAALLAFAFAMLMSPSLSVDAKGAACALASGVVASAVGYAMWYAALKRISGTTAASVQLSVPAIAALGGVAFLGEALSWTLVLSCTAILFGVAATVAGHMNGSVRPRSAPQRGIGGGFGGN